MNIIHLINQETDVECTGKRKQPFDDSHSSKKCKNDLSHCDYKEKKLLQCPHCIFYKSAHKSNLDRHIRIHAGEKPFKCSNCDYAATAESTLKNHIMRHTHDKPYKCSHCGHKFIKRYALNEHIRKHTGEKPFKCSECDYRCAHRSGLKYHIKSRH
jgi:KRAB domain-containing zinc finger protein